MLNIQISDIAANMPHQAKTEQVVKFRDYSDSYLYSPDTLPTHAPEPSEIWNEMFSRLDDSFADSDFTAQKNEIEEKFEYHFSQIQTICKYIIEESDDVFMSKDYKQADSAERLLNILQLCKSRTNDILKSLTEDMTERLFVEFCDRPDFC